MSSVILGKAGFILPKTGLARFDSAGIKGICCHAAAEGL